MKPQKPAHASTVFDVSNARWGVDGLTFTPVQNALPEARVLCDGGAQFPQAPLWLRIQKDESTYFIGILRGAHSDWDCLPANETLDILRLKQDSPLSQFNEKKILFGPFDRDNTEAFIQVAEIAALRMHHAKILSERKQAAENFPINSLT